MHLQNHIGKIQWFGFVYTATSIVNRDDIHLGGFVLISRDCWISPDGTIRIRRLDDETVIRTVWCEPASSKQRRVRDYLTGLKLDKPPYTELVWGAVQFVAVLNEPSSMPEGTMEIEAWWIAFSTISLTSAVIFVLTIIFSHHGELKHEGIWDARAFGTTCCSETSFFVRRAILVNVVT
jgi:hypothetical protein